MYAMLNYQRVHGYILYDIMVKIMNIEPFDSGLGHCLVWEKHNKCVDLPSPGQIPSRHQDPLCWTQGERQARLKGTQLLHEVERHEATLRSVHQSIFPALSQLGFSCFERECQLWIQKPRCLIGGTIEILDYHYLESNNPLIDKPWFLSPGLTWMMKG